VELYEALGLGRALGHPLVAIVGGGGKTASLFALGASAAERGGRVLLATTTHICDPRLERGRRFDRVVVDSLFASPPAPLELEARLASAPAPFPGAPSVSVLGARLQEYSNGEVSRLCGVDPAWPRRLAPSFDLVAVEADGSRCLPIKAPASHEPALPEGADTVLGLIGLECLGRPMDGATVHRPELFAEATGCALGEVIGPEHLLALARSGLGLFKNCARGTRRVLVLNKADLVGSGEAAAAFDFLASRGAADLVLLAAIGKGGEPSAGQVLERAEFPAAARGEGL
jgi:probable selenium-dependent hydroxylase accessory protein YqeC